jgi:hypothetical protein
MAAGDALSTVARDQRRWSLTANALKASIDRARWIVLGLAVAGAIFETLGAQIHGAMSDLARAFGYVGAAVLGVAAVIRQWKLGHERTQAWILARAGSESFKREIFLFVTSAGPYASGNPALTLLDRKDEILAKLQPCQNFRVEPQGDVETPVPLDAAAYLEKRVTGKKAQVQYFRDHADQYSRMQQRLHGAEFFLAVIAALLSAAVTLTETQQYGAWVAVITTVSGAVAAHLMAQRYEQLTITYRATADRLESVKDRWYAKGAVNLADLVESCEAVLFEENQGWIAGADQAAVPARNDTAGSK